MLKRDQQATIDKQYLSPYSYVANWWHEGTSHACEYLAGEDKGHRREDVFKRDKGKCWRCGAYYGLEFGELHHRQGGLGRQRCDCFENLAWSCRRCHRAEHVMVKWTKKS